MSNATFIRWMGFAIPRTWILGGLALGLATGCSIKKMAVNQLGNALAGGGTTFSSDDDPELVKAAVPFSLKLMEALLAESPRHSGLLLAAASGFTQYGFAFVQQEADEAEGKDFAAAEAMRVRARKLYLRARDYGLRGLDVHHPGFALALRKNSKQAVCQAEKRDVPLLYWTAAAWGAAISVSKNNPDLIADQGLIGSLIDRALELDESFDAGAIHSFLITYETVRKGGAGEPMTRARRHFERAMQLGGGTQAGPLVSFVEAVSIQQQNQKEFTTLLNQALEINPEAKPEFRLVNLVMQRRARWLLSRADELFTSAEPPSAKAKQ